MPDLRNDCIKNCENEMIECFYGCNNDSACLRECLRGETHCINCKLQVHPYCLVEFRVFVCGRFFYFKIGTDPVDAAYSQNITISVPFPGNSILKFPRFLFLNWLALLGLVA